MKFISILLIIIGIGGIGLGMAMFGDIGIAAIISGITAILSGAGFWLVQRAVSDGA